MATQSSGWQAPDNESSNIKFIKWDGDKETGIGTLTIEFNNKKRYEYSKVPKQTYKDLKAAESSGKYFHANIREKYETKEL